MRKILLLTTILVLSSISVVFAYTEVSANISENTTWTAGTYYITTAIAIQHPYALTIEPGVVVKFASGTYIIPNTVNLTTLDANGTSANPIYFTSMNDNTVGETISGSSGSPAAGDYTAVLYGTSLSESYYRAYFDYCIIRYATNPIETTYANAQIVALTDVEISNCTDGVNSRNTLSVTRTYMHDITNYCFERFPTSVTGYLIVDTCDIGVYGTYTETVALTNILALNCTTAGISMGDTGTVTLECCTAINCGVGFRRGGGNGNAGTMNVYDSIAYSCTKGFDQDNGTLTSNYCCANNNTANYEGCSEGENSISTDPVFASGTIDFWGTEDYDASYFLNQSTSNAKDVGSDTAANIGVDDRTTAIDKTLDTGTVDMGFHYYPDDVTSAGATYVPQVI